MSKIELLDLLQQDIEDLKGIVNYQEYGLTENLMKKQARAIILNLQEHLEMFVEKQ
mgnify:CR=1 FL=1